MVQNGSSEGDTKSIDQGDWMASRELLEAYLHNPYNWISGMATSVTSTELSPSSLSSPLTPGFSPMS